MEKRLQLDSLDKKILSLLRENGRMPYLEIARKCKVTGAAIHQRLQKLKETGVFSGTQIKIEPKGMGYLTCAFIGIQVNLVSETSHQNVFRRIREIPEIVECHHITGRYSLIVKIHAKRNEHLKQIIVEKIQSIPEVIGTETFLSLEEGFVRQLPVDYP